MDKEDGIQMDIVIVNPEATEIDKNKEIAENNVEGSAELNSTITNQLQSIPDTIEISDIKFKAPQPRPSVPLPIFVQFAMIMFGMSSFLAYNLFFNSTTYFSLKFAALEDISKKFPFYFNFAMTPTTVVCGFVGFFLIKLIRIETIVWESYIVIFTLFVLTTLLAEVDTTGYEMLFFVITLLTLIGMTVGAVLSTTALIALSSMMSPELVKRYFVGQGVSGIIAVLLNITFTAIPNFDGLKAGFYCFGFVTILIIIVLIIFYMFTKNSYVAFYLEKSINLTVDNANLAAEQKKTRVLVLIPKAAKLAFVTFVTNLIMLSIHPAFMTLLKQSENGTVEPKFFLLTHLFLVASVGNFSGKTFSQFVKFPGKDTILYYALSRIILAVLLIMCNIRPRTIPVWFNDDWVPALLMFIFCFTQGHIVSLSYSYAPSVVENGVDKAVVGTIHHCATFLGLICGTLITFLLQKIINL